MVTAHDLNEHLIAVQYAEIGDAFSSAPVEEMKGHYRPRPKANILEPALLSMALRCYLHRYPDLAKLFCQGRMSPKCKLRQARIHWDRAGRFEGRQLSCPLTKKSPPPPPLPPPMSLPPSPPPDYIGELQCYARRYPDLRKAHCFDAGAMSCRWHALEMHWLKHGRLEGRRFRCWDLPLEMLDAPSPRPPPPWPQTLPPPPPPGARGVVFIILTGPGAGAASGSWLPAVLESSPWIRFEGSKLPFMNRTGIRSWFDERDGAVNPGHAVGCKLKYAHLINPRSVGIRPAVDNCWPLVRSLLRAVSGRLICVSRRNYVQHAISKLQHLMQAAAYNGACYGDARTGNCTYNPASNSPVPVQPWGVEQHATSNEALTFTQPSSSWNREWSRAQRTYPGLLAVIQRYRENIKAFEHACKSETGRQNGLRVWRFTFEELMHASPDRINATSAALQRWLGLPLANLAPRLLAKRRRGSLIKVRNVDEVVHAVRKRFGPRSKELSLVLELWPTNSKRAPTADPSFFRGIVCGGLIVLLAGMTARALFSSA